MFRSHYEDFEKLSNAVYERCHGFLHSVEMAKVREALQALTKKYPGYSVSVNCNLEVFDDERKSILPLLRMGIVSLEGNAAYEHSADSSPQRYWANGDVCVVPHDHCPLCWGAWDFKFLHKQCPTCDAKLGKQVKYMLDSDQCPHCSSGKISSKQPKCTDCGFEAGTDEVVWG